jgi:DDE superfamily endonuclease
MREAGRRVHDVPAIKTPDALHALRTFRDLFDDCHHRRSDALFELTDAVLSADGVPSPIHLSLQTSYRRGWGSPYAALRRGRIDTEALRELLVRHPLGGGDGGKPPVYAVDVSVWPRCDAESSPDLGFCIPIF